MLITQDMAVGEGDAPLAQLLRYLVLGAITFKLFCGVPVCVLVLVDIFEGVYAERSGGATLGAATADAMRFTTWAGSIVCALLFRPYLQYITVRVPLALPPRPPSRCAARAAGLPATAGEGSGRAAAVKPAASHRRLTPPRACVRGRPSLGSTRC